MKSGPGVPKRLENMKGEVIMTGFKSNENDTEALWTHYLECVRSHNRKTLCPPELGAAAFTTVNMGVQSYRGGNTLFWDAEQRKPVPADASWAERWEKRSNPFVPSNPSGQALRLSKDECMWPKMQRAKPWQAGGRMIARSEMLCRDRLVLREPQDEWL